MPISFIDAVLGASADSVHLDNPTTILTAIVVVACVVVLVVLIGKRAEAKLKLIEEREVDRARERQLNKEDL